MSTQYQFYLGGGITLFSCLLALLLPNIDQEVIASEDVRFREFLESKGYDTSQMGIAGAQALPAYESGGFSDGVKQVDTQPAKTY